MKPGRGLLLFLAVLLSVPLACNLSRAQPTLPPATSTFIAPPTTDPNLIPSVTPIGMPTATPLAGTPVACVLPVDWFVYIVQPGDTLTDLALRVNSTVQELVTRNCLESADSIFVGQSLLVPVQLPPTG